MSPEEEELLLTSADVARMLAVEPETLAQWRYRRVGPPWVRVGKRFVRYRLDDVRTWLERHTIEPDDEVPG